MMRIGVLGDGFLNWGGGIDFLHAEIIGYLPRPRETFGAAFRHRSVRSQKLQNKHAMIAPDATV